MYGCANCWTNSKFWNVECFKNEIQRINPSNGNVTLSLPSLIFSTNVENLWYQPQSSPESQGTENNYPEISRFRKITTTWEKGMERRGRLNNALPGTWIELSGRCLHFHPNYKYQNSDSENAPKTWVWNFGCQGNW